MDARGSSWRDAIRILAFVVGAAFTGSPSYALGHAPARNDAGCGSPIDLRRGGLVEGLPSGEQGDTYACGFFVAGTLLDSFRLREEGLPAGRRSGLPIDPIALAIDLAVDADRPAWLPLQLTSDPLTDQDGRRGSYLCDIVQYVRENGVCDPGDARVFDREWMRGRSTLAMRLYEAARDVGYPGDMEEADERAAAVRALRRVLSADSSIAITDGELARILVEDSDSPYRVVQRILYPQCESRRVYAPFENLPSCGTSFYLGWEQLGLGEGNVERRAKRVESRIHARLEAERDPRDLLPVPLLHCYAALQKGRAFDGAAVLEEACITHYVNVIGRREKGGVCQFLVRNSYDPRDAEAVSPDWERDGEDFWVDAAVLSRSAFGVHEL